MKTQFDNDTLVVVMQRGERLAENLGKLIEMPGVKPTGTVVTALGLVRNVDIGYGMYEPEKVWYERKVLPGPLELLGLSGFILKSEKWPFHLHATLGGPDLSTFGGHIFDAEIVTFIEMTILMSAHEMDRVTVRGLPELAFVENPRRNGD